MFYTSGQNIKLKRDNQSSPSGSTNVTGGTRNNSTNTSKDTTKTKSLRYDPSKENPVAKITQYQVFNLKKDTTYIDTSLSIKDQYQFNYLRKDIFGLLPFLNEGQTYQTLQYGLQEYNAFPALGFNAKRFNYKTENDIKYYKVATPYTDLYYKTVMEQGQNVQTLVTVNTAPNFNFSLFYNGLRSLGHYLNQLSSTGNFIFTTSYHTKNKKYNINAHFASQDISNQENGGVINPDNFISKDNDFIQRDRIPVFHENATSKIDGQRYYINHSFRLNKKDSINNLKINHIFNYETQKYNYTQSTVYTDLGNNNFVSVYGEPMANSNVADESNYFKFQNKIGVAWTNKKLGDFEAFAGQFQYQHKYNRIIIDNSNIIPNKIEDKIYTIGGKYNYYQEKIKGYLQYEAAITNQGLLHVEAFLEYKHNDKIFINAKAMQINKLPNHTSNLFQSSWVNYNWFNNFDNEKTTQLQSNIHTPWVALAFNYSLLNDYLYYTNTVNTANVIVTLPKQYDKTIQYLSLKLNKDLSYKKFGIDNTVLFQTVAQDNNILNVPQLTARSTLYYNDKWFKKAMQVQVGIEANYFSEYYANGYNPLIQEFYVQEKTKIGNFPMLNLYLNARVKTARLYLHADQINTFFSKSNYFSAPNYPYRDFMIRFGLEWNFFL
ncbi:MAG: putative porin [Flavobacterium sp.]